MPNFNTTITPAIEAIDKIKMSYLHWLVTEDSDRQDRYRAYREYYDGEHDTQLTARMRKYLQIKVGEEFNTNYCPIVVDALAERLVVTGFKAEGQDEMFWEWWQDNRMDGLQGLVHLAAVRDGDTYLLIEWDEENGRPYFCHELAYDGAEGVKVHYSREKKGAIEFASKRWRVEQGAEAGRVRRLNLYFPNRIEKYISDSQMYEGNWQPYQPEGDASWPLWWTRTGTEAGEPLGVPVVHFRNINQGYDFGKSELKDVVPLQNALNKSIIDLLAAADTTAFRIFYMIGDDPSSLELTPGSWIYSKRPPGGDNGVDIGAIDGADPTPLIRLKNDAAMEIARVSRTPLSYFQTSGERPAEGTLKQEESGLVAKVLNRQIHFGNSWEDAFKMARRLYNTFGPGGLDEEQQIETVWKDPQTRNEKELIETVAMKLEKLGIPRETAWAEAGYSPEQIAEMMELKEKEQQQAMEVADAIQGQRAIRDGEEGRQMAEDEETPNAGQGQGARGGAEY